MSGTRTTMPATEARREFSTLVTRAGHRGERVVLTRSGKPLVAVVPVEDLELLEQLEDARDVRDAERALAEHEASGEPLIPWTEVQRQLDAVDAAEGPPHRAPRTRRDLRVAPKIAGEGAITKARKRAR